MSICRILAVIGFCLLLTACGGSPDSPSGTGDVPSGEDSAPPAASDVDAAPDVTTARGVDPSAWYLEDFECLLVHAPVDKISAALAAEGKSIQQAVDSNDTHANPFEAMCLLQFKGQTWTGVTGYKGDERDAARRFSGRIGGKAMTVGYEDNSGACYYYLYDSGKLVEKFECEGWLPFDPDHEDAEYWVPPNFHSTLRQVDFKKVDQTADEFVSDFVKSQDAFALLAFLTGKEGSTGSRTEATRCELGWFYEEPFPHEAVERLDVVLD